MYTNQDFLYFNVIYCVTPVTISGHRNHTGCCQRNGIPDACLGFCSGKMPPLDDNLSQCMIRLPMIEACIMEGLGNNIRIIFMNKNMVFKLWFLLVSKLLNTKT